MSTLCRLAPTSVAVLKRCPTATPCTLTVGTRFPTVLVALEIRSFTKASNICSVSCASCSEPCSASMLTNDLHEARLSMYMRCRVMRCRTCRAQVRVWSVEREVLDSSGRMQGTTCSPVRNALGSAQCAKAVANPAVSCLHQKHTLQCLEQA